MRRSLLLGTLTLLFAAPAFAADFAAVPNPVAVVNAEPISAEEFTRELLVRAGINVLNDLIVERLIRQDAGKRKISVADEELEARVKEFAQQREADRLRAGGGFNDWLADNSLTLDRFREIMQMRLLQEKLVQPLVQVSEEEVSTFYQAHKSESPITEPERRQLRWIVVSDQKLAEQIRADLVKDPSRFPELARKHSLDPATKEQGGLLPAYVSLNDPDNPVLSALFDLKKPGDISSVVASPTGFHILKLEDIQQKKEHNYDEVRKTLQTLIYRSKMARALDDYLADLREKAKIEIKLRLPEKAATAAQPPAAGR